MGTYGPGQIMGFPSLWLESVSLWQIDPVARGSPPGVARGQEPYGRRFPKVPKGSPVKYTLGIGFWSKIPHKPPDKTLPDKNPP